MQLDKRQGRSTPWEDVLGSNRAESDSRMLEKAFVPTADFDSLKRGPAHNFVVGRRGAGKSALYLQLSKEFTKIGDVVISFVPQEYRIKGLVAELRRRLKGDVKYNPVRSLMRVVWRAVMVARVTQDFSKRHGHRKAEYAQSAYRVSLLPWLSEDLIQCAHSIVEMLPDTEDPDKLVYEAATLTGCDELENAIRNDLVDSGSRALVLVDRLDEGWRPQDIEAGIVGGLCAAAVDLRDKKTNIHGLVFLRDNVFRLLEEVDDDFSRNIAGDNLRLRWTPDSLLDFGGAPSRTGDGL